MDFTLQSFSKMDPQAAAENAVSVIGSGYNLTTDLRLSWCKLGPETSPLIELDRDLTKDMVVPGGVVVRGVCSSINCDKGERTRFSSDMLSFTKMSEQFNRELALSGKIPSGMFNARFGFKGCWQKDAAVTKTLAFDGSFITLYSIELAKSQITLSEQVKKDIPSYWDPAALAEFIEKYGTHIVVGVKMGGQDAVYIKQLQNSNLQANEVRKLLKQQAAARFCADTKGMTMSSYNKPLGNQKDDEPWMAPIVSSMRPSVTSHSKDDDLMSIHIRRGGFDIGQSHNEWLSTVALSPNVISMSFVPIASLLSGLDGSGFLSHAINLYLRYKPPIEELQHFLEFQLPRQWAPAYNDLPLASRHRKQASPSLKFTFLGPRLYVNTVKVDSMKRPVTGVRLYLEGKRSDHLAIHLQHLSTIPHAIELVEDRSYEPTDEPQLRQYFEPVKWSIFSHVCTAPLEHEGESASVVTKAWFEVKTVGMKKVLFLRLGYSIIPSARIRRHEWEEPTTSSRKSGLMSMLTSTPFSTPLSQPDKLAKVDLNSAVYPGGPPLPARAPKLSNFVDTKEMVRGPEVPPGYWVVTGAKLCTDGGKIRIKVKYSLVTIISEDSFIE